MNHDDWFETLAGRATKDGDKTAVLEARLLRAAMLRQAELAEAEPISAEQIAALARPAPQRSPWRCAPCAARWQRVCAWFDGAAPGWRYAAAATLAALALFGLWRAVLAPGELEAPVLRGSAGQQPGGSWLLSANDPARARDSLAETLARSGATITSYERLGRLGLGAEWPRQALPAEARDALSALGVQAIDGQPLQIEFELRRP